MSGPRDEGGDVARPNEVLQLAANNAFQPGIGNLLDLRFEAASFDAVYARNCLIHVPNAELDGALAGIARVLRPEGLFYLSVYGEGSSRVTVQISASLRNWPRRWIDMNG